MKHVLKMNDHDFEEYELPKKIIVLYLNEKMEYERNEEIPY